MSMSRAELDAQRHRAATNQSLFRDVNEGIEELATGSFASFVCECMQEGCDERVHLTVDEYEEIRAHPNRFFVLDGHDVPAVERVLERTDRYVVVEKLGVGETAAEERDPR